MPATGTTTQRDYGAQHQAKRAEWKPYVEGTATRPGHIDGRRVIPGHVDCHAARCLEDEDGYSRRIATWQEWDLGHTPDRSRWTGPEHRRCNRSEGARRGNQQRGGLSARMQLELLDDDGNRSPALGFFD